jgi:hypothetical protein
MMDLDFLLNILDNWALWMRSDNHRLGYPKKSILLSSGGESVEGAFDHMVEEMDLKHVETIDAIIEDLPKELKMALYARYLRSKKPMYYEIKLNEAIEQLLQLAKMRIN